MRKRVQHAPAHELNLDKKAQRMVEEVRLKNIEREHRSVGAVLDTRTLVPLVAPRLRQGALNRAEQEKRRSERRDAVETPTAVMEKSEAAIRSMTRRGEAIVSVDNFENEELIWTTKTKDPNYSQDRKYYHKDLQHFKDHMSSEQRREFKLQTHERLVELATKYRAEMSRMKEEMDLAGVFHPDANAHRAHCMYLMKLYKGIRADTIEDPVLRKLRDEEQSQKRAAEEEEKKQRELIESIENKNKGTVKVAAVAAPPPPAPAPPPPPLADKKTNRVSVGEKITTMTGSGGASSSASALRKSKSLPALAPKPQEISKKGKSASSKGLLSHMAATVVEEKHESGDKESRPEHNGESGGAEEEGGGLAPGADIKLFTKIKRGKLGGADPKTILLEEAARLEKSDVLDVKKTRERSSLVDSEMTSWMLSLLQKNQIEKTAQGRDVVPTTIDLFASARASLPVGTDETGSVLYSPDKASALRDDVHSSTRMVPFAEFYDMFRQYSAEAKDRKEKEEEKELKRQEKEAKRLARLHQHHDHHHDEEEDDLNSPHSSPSKFRGNASGEGENTDGVLVDHLVDNEASGIDAIDAASFVITHHHAGGKGGGEPMLHEYLQETAGPKKTNLVQVMKETDPLFDAYYKTMLRQKPQGARLFKGTVTKVPKLRVVAPLGKAAVVITDTRGKEKAVSSKGFYNVFTTRLATDETTVESSQITLETQKTDEDDKSVEVVASTNFPDASPPGSRTAPRDEEQPHQQQQQQRSRTPSPSNARRSRNRSRGKKPGAAEQSTGESAATVVLDFQTKLVCVWDCLQLPAQHRLQFMRKYASKAYASELSRAIDLWAECAVLILARINMVDHNLVKVREGYSVLPLRARDLLDPLNESLPEAMTSTAQALCFQATESSPLSTPLSVLALDELRKVVGASFPSSASTDVQTGRTQSEAEEQLQRLGTQIEGMIVKTAARLGEELNDTVTFAGMDYREWIAKLKAPQVQGKV
jgi:hypothetical protein